MKIRFKLWLEDEGKVLFGHGRHELLAAIEETGSLAGAAKKLDMSYRAAWGRLKASEERLGWALVEPGSQGRRSSRLTPQGRELLRWYLDLEKRVEDFVAQAARKHPSLP